MDKNRMPPTADVPSDRETSFLTRWSERKRSAREHESLPDEPEDAAPSAATEVPETPETQLVDADMPALESLDENSDYSGFLSPGVSDKLRKVALRKLFHLPVFNIRDGLDDYDEDFTTFEPLGDIITADMRHQMEVQAEKAKQALADTEAMDDEAALTDERAEPEQAASDFEPPRPDGEESLDEGEDADEELA